MKIRRDIMDDLRRWKESADRKPIVLKGARQTGKTWIMREFGKECFDYVAEFNFDKVGELNTPAIADCLGAWQNCLRK